MRSCSPAVCRAIRHGESRQSRLRATSRSRPATGHSSDYIHDADKPFGRRSGSTAYRRAHFPATGRRTRRSRPATGGRSATFSSNRWRHPASDTVSNSSCSATEFAPTRRDLESSSISAAIHTTHSAISSFYERRHEIIARKRRRRGRRRYWRADRSHLGPNSQPLSAPALRRRRCE